MLTHAKQLDRLFNHESAPQLIVKQQHQVLAELLQGTRARAC